jgi:hypothetical protein
MATIVPFERQRIAHRAAEENFFTLYGGGVRGGKTFWGLLQLFHWAFKYPGSSWLIIRKTLPTLQRTTLKDFNMLLNEYGMRQYLAKWDGSLLTATWNNGSQWVFMSENYEDDKELFRFRGLAINGALCEELNELQEATFDKIIERCGTRIIPNGATPPPKIIATCNPSNNWLKRRVYDPWREGKLKKGWTFVPSYLADNPHNTPEYRQSMEENMSTIKREQFVEGNWDIVDIDNPFASSFIYSKHVGELGPPQKKRPLILSFDFNFNPITCVVSQYADGPKTGDLPTERWLRFHKEFRLEKSKTETLCDAILREFPGYYYWVTGDASGTANSALTGTINHYVIIRNKLKLMSSQLKLFSKNPNISNNREHVNWMLENFPVTVDRRLCPFLVEDLQTVTVYKSAEDVLKIDKSDESKGHLLDGFRYTFHAFFPHYIKDMGRK